MAEIISYDFKEQAFDLIHDIEIWGNLDFKGTIDPNNPFLASNQELMD